MALRLELTHDGLYCPRSTGRWHVLWTWLHEPPGSRASSLVPSRSTTIKLTSEQRRCDRILVKRRCVRSRRFVCLLAARGDPSSISCHQFIGVLLNLLTTTKFRIHPRNYFQAAGKRNIATSANGLQTNGIRVRVRFARKASRRRIGRIAQPLLADLTLASGPAASPVVQECL